MILAGGKQGGTWLLNVEKYDIEGVLTAAPNLSYRRSGPGCIMYNEEVYVAGGYNAGSRLSDVEVFDLKTNVWRIISKMNNEREFPGIFVYDNQLTVFGGYGTDPRSIEVYNGISWENSKDTLTKDFYQGVLVGAKCPV
ncbi:kelch-like protein 12 [Eurytemora carolleeae]|uniref:kelch-like protein 12 n=1 Tax=Eurytemora carolleeae TaxID=1294199 RepID=UPI000C77FC30|nr:kelch-like protein 12 [Eurytemora carolleeae]|eukprot:XP_023348030.1 kelch-like protein 12 [Eurytemora affinis]